jgi:hypothetical protein
MVDLRKFLSISMVILFSVTTGCANRSLGRAMDISLPSVDWKDPENSLSCEESEEEQDWDPSKTYSMSITKCMRPIIATYVAHWINHRYDSLKTEPARRRFMSEEQALCGPQSSGWTCSFKSKWRLAATLGPGSDIWAPVLVIISSPESENQRLTRRNVEIRDCCK